MWSEIQEKAIVRLSTHGISSIPEGTAVLAATKLIKMLQWIYDEFILDSSTNTSIFISAEYKEQENFIIRNTSRTLSYVNHLYVLEGVLNKIYGETIDELNKIDSNIVLDTGASASRKVEVEDYFIFRHKVSAHTAYGSPWSEDNAAMKFQSLVSLLSTSFDQNNNSDSFALGPNSVRLAGQDPSTRLPVLSLKDLHPKMLLHIESWTKMLIDPCTVARTRLPMTINSIQYYVNEMKSV